MAPLYNSAFCCLLTDSPYLRNAVRLIDGYQGNTAFQTHHGFHETLDLFGKRESQNLEDLTGSYLHCLVSLELQTESSFSRIEQGPLQNSIHLEIWTNLYYQPQCLYV